MGNPVDTTAGLTPPPVEMSPMEVRPARPPEPLPPSAGWGGKTAGGLNIAASFLEGWMRGKQMHELAARKRADTEVAGHRQMFVQAVQGYRDFVASEPKPTDPAKLAEWQAKETNLKAAAAAAQQHYADVMQKYTFPEEQTAKGVKGKLKQFGSNVKKEMTPQDPHMFAQTVLDSFRKQPIETALQGGRDQRIMEAELAELKGRTAKTQEETIRDKRQNELNATADTAFDALQEARRKKAPPEEIQRLQAELEEKDARARNMGKVARPEIQKIVDAKHPILGKTASPAARTYADNQPPDPDKWYIEVLTDHGIKLVESGPPDPPKTASGAFAQLEEAERILRDPNATPAQKEAARLKHGQAQLAATTPNVWKTFQPPGSEEQQLAPMPSKGPVKMEAPPEGGPAIPKGSVAIAPKEMTPAQREKLFEPLFKTQELLQSMRSAAKRGIENHDAQAQVAVISYHIAMTAKMAGIRPTQSFINEAKEARSWGEGMIAKIGSAQYGTFLSQKQIEQMVGRAEDLYKIMRGTTEERAKIGGVEKYMPPDLNAKSPQTHAFSKKAWLAKHPGEDAEKKAQEYSAQGYRIVD